MEPQTPITPIPNAPEQSPISPRTQRMIIAGGIALLILFIAAIVLMAFFPATTVIIRDIAIVLVAVETFLMGLAVIILIFQVQSLIQVLRDEVQPLLRSVNDTASTVRGTTEFMSQNVVSPFIKWAGVTAAVQRVTIDLIKIAEGTWPRAKPVQNQTGNGGSENG